MRLNELLDVGLVEQANYQLFVDMDGVVADFDAGVKRVVQHVYGELPDISNYETDPESKKIVWNAIKKYQKQGGEFWYELPVLSDAYHLWNFVKNYSPQFLTATGPSDMNSEEQKRKWVTEKFGNIPVLAVEKTQQKYKYADDNHILIDDKEKAIQPWRQADGVGILHKSANQTTKQLQQLGL